MCLYVYCRDGHSVCLLLDMYDSSFLFIVRLRDTNFKWMVFIVRNYSLSYLVQLAVIPALNWLMHLLAQLVYVVPKDFCFTSVAYFFIFAFSLTLRSQNQCMDASWVCYEQLGIWCSFSIPRLDSSPSPPWGTWGNCPKFRQKFDGAFVHWLVLTKRCNVWKWEIFFRKRDSCPTFRWKIRKPPLPIFEEVWRTRCTSFFYEPCSLYYHSPDGAVGTG